MNDSREKRSIPPEASPARTTDYDTISKIGEVGIKWLRALAPAITLLFGAFMATVWKPLRSIPELHQKIELGAFNDSVSFVERKELKRGQAITFKVLCFNLPLTDRIKYDIDCGDIPIPPNP
jgi:hypothetical protein